MFQIDGSLPLISCLLVTANGRFDYFRRSCQCYFDQTYPNRELVVVNEGSRQYQEQIASFLANRSDVRLIFLDGKYTLGSLRNISIALSHGDVFVQWDDDDFNTPERIALQFSHLRNHPRARVCYLTDQLHYYFTNKRLFWNDWWEFHSGGRKEYSLIPGTIMAYKEGFSMRYPSSGANCRAGEDSVLAYDLLKQEDNVLLLHGYGHMQMYTFHGSNVWDLEHHMKISRERSLPSSHLIKYRHKICETLDYLRLDGPIKVTGREGLAFIYGGAS